jgi:hypothetical protein
VTGFAPLNPSYLFAVTVIGGDRPGIFAGIEPRSYPDRDGSLNR